MGRWQIQIGTVGVKDRKESNLEPPSQSTRSKAGLGSRRKKEDNRAQREESTFSSSRSFTPSPEPKRCRTEGPLPPYIPAGAEEEDSTWDKISNSGDSAQMEDYLAGGGRGHRWNPRGTGGAIRDPPPSPPRTCNSPYKVGHKASLYKPSQPRMEETLVEENPYLVSQRD